MSDTEEAPTPVKAKRTMTPEARERMLANLAKGREAKLKKAAERRQSKSDQEKRETNEKDLGVSYGEPINQKLTCPGCRRVFKHSSSKSNHVKKCKFIASNNVVVQPPPVPDAEQSPVQDAEPKDAEPKDAEQPPVPDVEPPPSARARKPARRKRQQKVTIIESESEPSSSEDELIVRRKKKRRARKAPASPAPTLTPEQVRLQHEHERILMLSRQMDYGGLTC